MDLQQPRMGAPQIKKLTGRQLTYDSKTKAFGRRAAGELTT
jgi:hypothetical protein